jgi:hypothetical protein
LTLDHTGQKKRDDDGPSDFIPLDPSKQMHPKVHAVDQQLMDQQLMDHDELQVEIKNQLQHAQDLIKGNYDQHHH